MSSEVRKTKRATTKAQNKELDILRVTRKCYIGSMYINGVTLYLTTTHAVLSRAYSHNVFMLGSPNYGILRQTYELHTTKDRTEEQEHEYRVGQIFMLSFQMQDFAASSASNITFNHELFNLYLAKVNRATEEELIKEYAIINSIVKNSLKIDNGEIIDQSDLESEEVEIKNMLDLNHVREGFNMVDSIPDEVPSESTN